MLSNNILDRSRTILEHASALSYLAADSRPSSACAALPPSAPEPPTLTPQPVADALHGGRNRGDRALRDCPRRLPQLVAKTAPAAVAPAARSRAGHSALRPSRGARAFAAPFGARRGALLSALFRHPGFVFTLRLYVERNFNYGIN